MYIGAQVTYCITTDKRLISIEYNLIIIIIIIIRSILEARTTNIFSSLRLNDYIYM